MPRLWRYGEVVEPESHEAQAALEVTVARDDLKLLIPPPPPLLPECWDYRQAPPHPVYRDLRHTEQRLYHTLALREVVESLQGEI